MKQQLLLIASIITLTFSGSPSAVSQWKDASGQGCGTVYCMAVSGKKIFAGTNRGLFRSTDNGTHWMMRKLDFQEYFTTAIGVADSKLFLTCDSGSFLSTDDGRSWEAINKGLPTTDVRAFVPIGKDIFAVTPKGALRWSNDDRAWIPVGMNLPNSLEYSLAANGSNLFAGTLAEGIFLSTDNGRNWIDLHTSDKVDHIISIAASDNELYAGTNRGVFTSTDKGTTWSVGVDAVGNNYVQEIVIGGGNLFALSDPDIFRSTNDGINWENLSIFYSGKTRALVVSGGNLFAGTNFGIYRSTDSGESWTNVLSSTGSLPGFLGISWGATLEEATKVMMARDGVSDIPPRDPYADLRVPGDLWTDTTTTPLPSTAAEHVPPPPPPPSPHPILSTLFFYGGRFGAFDVSRWVLQFGSDGMFSAKVYLAPEHEAKFLDLWNGVISALSSIHGDPWDEHITYSEPYKDGDGYEGQAFELGKAEANCEWNFDSNGEEPNTLSMTIDDKLNTIITYQNYEMWKKIDKEIKKKESKDY